MVIAVGIFAVGADRLVEIFQGPYGVLQVKVGCAAADVGVGYLVFLEDEFVEILWMPLEEVMQKIQAGEISDAKTIIAAQYAWMHKGE